MRDIIERIEVFPLRLPYRSNMQFSSSVSSSGTFTLLRLTTRDGAEGIAEATAYANAPASDPRAIALQLEALRPVLIGADPWDHQQILASLGRLRVAAPANALIDVALWDLKGKLLGQPVCRLLGAGPALPIPVTAIAFGETPEAMIAAAEAAAIRGLRSLKLKVWRRSLADVAMVGTVRQAIGADIFLYADANHSYTEMEARQVFPKLADHGVAMIEDPSAIPVERLALLARALPLTILSDIPIDSLASAQRYLRSDAVGALSLHVGRTGITETLKIAALCEAAGVTAVIGTDLEASTGALVRLHLCAALPRLRELPAETQFFENVAEDILEHPLAVVDGAIAVPERPGFGATIDAAKLRRYAA